MKLIHIFQKRLPAFGRLNHQVGIVSLLGFSVDLTFVGGSLKRVDSPEMLLLFKALFIKTTFDRRKRISIWIK